MKKYGDEPVPQTMLATPLSTDEERLQFVKEIEDCGYRRLYSTFMLDLYFDMINNTSLALGNTDVVCVPRVYSNRSEKNKEGVIVYEKMRPVAVQKHIERYKAFKDCKYIVTHYNPAGHWWDIIFSRYQTSVVYIVDSFSYLSEPKNQQKYYRESVTEQRAAFQGLLSAFEYEPRDDVTPLIKVVKCHEQYDGFACGPMSCLAALIFASTKGDFASLFYEIVKGDMNGDKFGKALEKLQAEQFRQGYISKKYYTEVIKQTKKLVRTSIGGDAEESEEEKIEVVVQVDAASEHSEEYIIEIPRAHKGIINRMIQDDEEGFIMENAAARRKRSMDSEISISDSSVEVVKKKSKPPSPVHHHQQHEESHHKLQSNKQMDKPQKERKSRKGIPHPHKGYRYEINHSPFTPSHKGLSGTGVHRLTKAGILNAPMPYITGANVEGRKAFTGGMKKAWHGNKTALKQLAHLRTDNKRYNADMSSLEATGRGHYGNKHTHAAMQAAIEREHMIHLKRVSKFDHKGISKFSEGRRASSAKGLATIRQNRMAKAKEKADLAQ